MTDTPDVGQLELDLDTNEPEAPTAPPPLVFTSAEDLQRTLARHDSGAVLPYEEQAKLVNQLNLALASQQKAMQRAINLIAKYELS